MNFVYHATLEGDRVHWTDGERRDSTLSSVPVTVVFRPEANHGTASSKPLIQKTVQVVGGDACFSPYRLAVWQVIQAWQQGRTDEVIRSAIPF